MKQLIETIIKEWWQRPLPTIIPRDRQLKEFLHMDIRKAIMVTGFRRVGKTYLLLELAKQLGQGGCLYVNFEDERLPKTTQTLTLMLDVLTELRGNQNVVLLLDEIQNIPDWSSWVRRILETTQHELFLSGSSSKLSSYELPTQLRGRSLSIPIHPLNFREFLRFKNKDVANLPKPEILGITREYVSFGGFPEVALVDEGKKHLVVDEYLQTFILRDLVDRYHIRDGSALRQLIHLLGNAPYYTISALAKTIASKATIARYIQYLEDSFFLSSLTLHTPSIKNRLKAQRKPYFVDSFLLSRLSTEFSHNFGRLMEQVVHETLAARIESDPHQHLYYWKNYAGHEVDFVIRRQEEVTELIQVSFASDRTSLSPRETRSLTAAQKIFGCDNAKIITWDLESEQCVPLYKWL